MRNPQVHWTVAAPRCNRPECLRGSPGASRAGFGWSVLALIAFLSAPLCARAQLLETTNRLILSARFGLNISAKFKPIGVPALPTSPRTAPDGLPYDYDDGYVHTDISGNFGGQTWNWGYDDSSRQVVGNTIEMSRSVPVGNIPASTVDFGFSDGAEIAYNRRLGAIGEGRFGLEIAANYLGLGRGDDTSFAGQVGRTTDAYPFTPGTTPPAATPTNVYQGTFNGPGFVINTNFTRRNDVVSTAIITGRRRFDADVWGFRLGPYLEVPLDERLQLSLSAGLAVAVINAEASWRETVSLAGHGSASLAGAGRDEGVRFGGYVGGNLLWRLNEHWNAVAGVQYQNLGTYQHAFGGREVELDLRHSIFVMVGVGYGF